MPNPLLPVYTALGAALELRDSGLEPPAPDPVAVKRLAELSPGLAPRLHSLDPGLAHGLLDEGLSRLARIPGVYTAALTASMLFEELSRKGALRVVYLDVGSRGSPARPGGLFMLKEAEVVVEAGRGGAREDILHPVMRPFGPLLPLQAGRRAERIRQAARYVAELARVYRHLRVGVRSATPTLVYKHGPLVELIPIYMNRVYDADDKLYRAVLLYAGLDAGTAERLIDASIRDGLVNPGLLALNILSCIARLSTPPVFAVGVVEDTSGSRHLASQLLYESIVAASTLIAERGGGANVAVLQEMLKRFAERGSRILRAKVEACGLDAGLDAEDAAALEELAYRLNTRALRWGYPGLKSLTGNHALLAAAVYNEASSIEVDDAALLLHAAFLRDVGVTAPVPSAAFHGLLARAAEERLEGSLQAHVQGLAMSLAHLYVYAVPGPLPSCERLSSMSERLGVEPSRLASLTRAKLPLRVDTVAPGERLVEAAELLTGAAALAQLAASTSAYGMPHGILKADVASRVTLDEALILAELARRLEGRLVPYGVVLRHWPRRSALL